MKAILGGATLVALATFTLMRAMGADAPSRPPGVSPNEWAPISESLGIVLVDQLTGAGDAPEAGVGRQGAPAGHTVMSGGTALIAPVTGYLMVKRGTVWQRLIVIEPVKGPGSAG